MPSKGRLEEQVSALFNEADLPLVRPARGYEGSIKGLKGVRVLYLSASEIAKRLIAGGINLGITGEDLLREQARDAGAAVTSMLDLDFGHADVVLAIPDELPIKTMEDFADYAAEYKEKHSLQLRVATKYKSLAERFFDEHEVFDAITEYSDGATEGAPASGAAEAIVDITSTGDTLRANGLRILSDGLILKSQAKLLVSHNSDFSESAHQQSTFIYRRLNARLLAKSLCQIQVISSRDKMSTEMIKTLNSEYGSDYLGHDQFLVPKESIHKIREYLFEKTDCYMVIEFPEQKMIYRDE